VRQWQCKAHYLISMKYDISVCRNNVILKGKNYSVLKVFYVEGPYVTEGIPDSFGSVSAFSL
jgi:hypothetical protein